MQQKYNKFLVLGSSGQIGDPLCKFLESKGHAVVRFDIEDGKEFDLRTPNNRLLAKHMNECDFVYFLAFDVGGSRYLKKHQHTFEFIHNNTKIMQNVFEELSLTEKPFLFVSSQMSEMLHSPYGIAKAMGESYAKSLGGLVVKLWNVYGPEHDENKSHVITDLIKRAIPLERRIGPNSKILPVMSTGDEERQFLHVDDCCEAFYSLASQYNTVPRDKELHISSFEWSTIKSVVEIIANKFWLKPQYSKNKDIVQGMRIEPNAYPVLQYWQGPKISLEVGINSIILEMKQNQYQYSGSLNNELLEAFEKFTKKAPDTK